MINKIAKKLIGFTELRNCFDVTAKFTFVLTQKSLQIHVIETTSAPPLTTKDVSYIERRINKSYKEFSTLINPEIQIRRNPYIFMKGLNNNVEFMIEFTLYIKNKNNIKLLKKIIEELS